MIQSVTVPLNKLMNASQYIILLWLEDSERVEQIMERAQRDAQWILNKYTAKVTNILLR